MSETNVFSILSQEISAARSIERTREQALSAARAKIYTTWQTPIMNMLMEANGFLQPTGISFVNDLNISRSGSAPVGVSVPIYGMKRVSKIEFSINDDPTFAEVKLLGHDRIEKVGIATSVFPKHDFEEAVAALIRQASPELNIVETLID